MRTPPSIGPLTSGAVRSLVTARAVAAPLPELLHPAISSAAISPARRRMRSMTVPVDQIEPDRPRLAPDHGAIRLRKVVDRSQLVLLVEQILAPKCDVEPPAVSNRNAVGHYACIEKAVALDCRQAAPRLRDDEAFAIADVVPVRVGADLTPGRMCDAPVDERHAGVRRRSDERIQVRDVVAVHVDDFQDLGVEVRILEAKTQRLHGNESAFDLETGDARLARVA